MFRWLVTNLRILLLAFTLAVAVWVSAVTSANPDEIRQYPDPILIDFIGQDPGLVLAGTLPQSVTVSLRAPRSIWDKMTEQENSVRAVAYLAGLKAGSHTVNIQVQVSVQPVRIISITPETLELTLEPLSTRTIPIELSLLGEPATGFQAGDPKLTPLETLISGPDSLISRVAHVRAMLDVTGVRQDITREILLTATDDQDIMLTGVTLQPESVQVTLPVIQLGGYRDLAVKVVTYGRPANGYRLTSVVPIPAVVTVFSTEPELISALPGYVETAPLDLAGASADIETPLRLILPVGITLVGEQTVLVQVGISPIEGSLTLTDRPVEITNLGDGLQVQISPEQVDVILTGPLPTLNSLTPTDVRVLLDLKELGPGTYHITPIIEFVIHDITVESILPGTIEVIISPATTPTP